MQIDARGIPVECRRPGRAALPLVALLLLAAVDPRCGIAPIPAEIELRLTGGTVLLAWPGPEGVEVASHPLSVRTAEGVRTVRAEDGFGLLLRVYPDASDPSLAPAPFRVCRDASGGERPCASDEPSLGPAAQPDGVLRVEVAEVRLPEAVALDDAGHAFRFAALCGAAPGDPLPAGEEAVCTGAYEDAGFGVFGEDVVSLPGPTGWPVSVLRVVGDEAERGALRLRLAALLESPEGHALLLPFELTTGAAQASARLAGEPFRFPEQLGDLLGARLSPEDGSLVLVGAVGTPDDASGPLAGRIVALRLETRLAAPGPGKGALARLRALLPDRDADGTPDAVDPDDDGDGLLDDDDRYGERDPLGFAVGDAVCVESASDPGECLGANHELAAGRGAADGDADGDGIDDFFDNCTAEPNPDQRDTDADGLGDLCDPDLDGDGLVGPSDFFGFFRPCLGARRSTRPACAAADLDGDGLVGVADFFRVFRPRLGLPPGPAGPGAEAGTPLDPEGFVPIDANGQPLEGGVVRVGSDGSLPPFELRPGGRSPLGIGQGLGIRFPAGGRRVELPDGAVIEFSEATADFGPESPLSLDPPLSVSGGTHQLPAEGPLSVEDLMAAFGIDPNQGIPVTLYGTHSLRWVGGRLEGGVLREPAFLPDTSALPLPFPGGGGGGQGGLGGGALGQGGVGSDLELEDGLRLAFHGSTPVPDGSTTPPLLSVPPTQPLVLTLRPDGSLGLEGRVDLAFPGGPRFRADLTLDGPFYELAFYAENLQVPLLDALATVLPAGAAGCVPAGGEAGALDGATRCLEHFAAAYENFTASVVGATPADAVPAGGSGASGSSPTLPSRASLLERVNLATAALDAWGHAAFADAGAGFSLADVRDVVEQAGRAAEASRDLAQVGAYHRALVRARAAVAEAAASAGPADRAALAEALQRVRRVALQRADDPAAARSAASVREALERLVEADELAVEAGLDPQETGHLDVAEAFRRLLRRFLGGHLQDLGVESGVFLPEDNPIAAALNRFQARAALETLLELDRAHRSLSTGGEGLLAGGPAGLPVAEAATQMLLRWRDLTFQRAVDARQASDAVAFFVALRDFMEVDRAAASLLATGSLPPAVQQRLVCFDGDPESFDLPCALGLIGVDLATLVGNELDRPGGERSLESLTAELRTRLDVVRRFPDDFGAIQPLALADHDRIQQILDLEMAALPQIEDPERLLVLLEAGTASEELAEIHGLTENEDWEGIRLPLVVARLGAVAEASRDWTSLLRAARYLLSEAHRFAEAGAQVRRRSYLVHTGDLLQRARNVSFALWLLEGERREQGSAGTGGAPAGGGGGQGPGDRLYEGPELLLPGNLVVERVAGSLSYHRDRRYLAGTLSGRLSLPGFGATLELVGGSFDSGGAFALQAHGSVQLPPGGSAATLSITPRRPLQVRFRPPDDLALAGSARVQLDSGLFFEAFLVLDDPLYGFGMEAGGLRLDLADALRIYVPELPDGEVFTAAVATSLADALSTLNATYEGLAAVAERPLVGDPGSPPAFRDLQLTVPTDGVEAWANTLLADAARGVSRSYASLREPLRESLRALAGSVRELRSQLTDLETLARTLGALERAAAAADALDPEVLDMAELEAAVEATCDAAKDLLASPGSSSSLRRGRRVFDLATRCVAATVQVRGPDADDVTPQLPAFLESVRQGEFRNLGFDPQTGEVSDPAILDGQNLLRLRQSFETVQEITATAAAAGVGADLVTPYRTALGHLFVRIRAQALAELRELFQQRPQLHRRRQDLIDLLMELAITAEAGYFEYPPQVELFDGSFAAHTPTEDFAYLAGELSLPSIAQIPRQEKLREMREPGYRFYTRLVRTLDRAGQDLDAATSTQLDALADELLDELEDFATQPWPAGVVRDANAALGLLLDVATWLEYRDLPGFARIPDVVLPELTVRLVGSAEAQRAWWLLQRYTELLLEGAAAKVEGSTTVLESALLAASADALRGAGRVAAAFESEIFDAPFVPVDLVLPGDLRIDRVFGQIFYDRDQQLLSGTFGGRLSFPELDGAFFEVSQASLDTAGNLSVDAATAGPLPFDGLAATAALSVSYARSTASLDVSGTGSLLFDTGERVDVGVAYDTETDVLAFTSLAQGLEIRFGDDFVIFQAGLDFALSTVRPQGRLGLTGSAGLFARKPLPPPDPLGASTVSGDDFHLFIEGLTVVIEADPLGFSVALDNGLLHLPSFMSPSLCAGGVPGPTDGPVVNLGTASPLTLDVLFGDPPLVSVNGSVDFANLGFRVPDLSNLTVEVCSATLTLQGATPPVLSGVNGRLRMELPEDTLEVALQDATWDLAGFPVGRVRLIEDFTLFENGGFAVTLRSDDGQSPTSCQISAEDTCLGTPLAGTGFAVCDAGGVPRFELVGNLDLTVPGEVLALADPPGGDATVRAGTCGGLAVEAGPTVEVLAGSLFVAGDFRLGGSGDGTGGVLVRGASLAVADLQNLFGPPGEDLFSVVLSGVIQVGAGGPGFGLQGATFRFRRNQLPIFGLGGLQVSTGDLALFDGLSVNVTDASLSFADPDLPLLDGQGRPALIAPSNLEISVSGTASIPPVTGAVDDLVLVFDPSTGLPEVDFSRLEGLGFGIQDLEIPPLFLTGKVFLGGFENPPESLFLAGRLGAKFEGAGLVVSAAFSVQDGPIGLCIDVSAGPGGIPLGQSTFLLTGVAGGVVFPPDPTETFADPCSFVDDYFTPGGDPISAPAVNGGTGAAAGGSGGGRGDWRARQGAALSWAAFDAQIERLRAEHALLRAAPPVSPRPRGGRPPVSTSLAADPGAAGGGGAGGHAGGDAPLVFGDCPPPSISLLCQPHPDAASFDRRVIVKFTSLTEEQVDAILENAGLDPVTLAGMTPSAIGAAVAQAVRDFVESLWPLGSTPELEALFQQQLDAAQGVLQELVEGAVADVTGDAEIRQAIVDAAYAGIPCPSVVVKLSATLSQVAVSSFLSATGSYVLNDGAGTGLGATIHLMGIPVGSALGYFSLTDAEGRPEPSVCGTAEAGIGPLEFGRLDALYECPGCIGGVLQAVGGLATCAVEPAARAALCAALHRVAPEAQPDPADADCDAAGILQTLVAGGAPGASDPVIAATQVVGELFQSGATTLGAAFPACFAGLIGQAYDTMNPVFGLGGVAQAKLFGLPATPELASVNALLAKDADTGHIVYTAEVGLSPSHLLSTLFYNLLPVFDSGTLGVRYTLPVGIEALQAGLRGDLADPAALGAYAEAALNDFLDGALYTLSYQISPFGIPLANAEGRLLLPDLLNHPVRTGFEPGTDIAPPLPSRRALLIQSVATPGQFLGNPFWAGDRFDLFEIYPEGTPERAALENCRAGALPEERACALREDFFPHGGLVGAGRMRLPRLLIDAPPVAEVQTLASDSDLLTKVAVALDLLDRYVTGPDAMAEVGTLAFYLPAPNPPTLALDPGAELGPAALIQDILENFDPAGSSASQPPSFYPIEVAFLEGELETSILGVPIGEARVAVEPPSLFEIRASLDEAACPLDDPTSGNWLRCFVPAADLVFRVTQEAPAQVPFEERFAGVQAALQAATTDFDRIAALAGLDAALTLDLPDVELVAGLQDLRIPPGLDAFLAGGANATLYAYTPRFAPGACVLPGTLAAVRCHGGLLLEADLDLRLPGSDGTLLRVDQARLAVEPRPGQLPRLVGELQAALLPLVPGVVEIEGLDFSFDTAPEALRPILAGSGALRPVVLSPTGAATCAAGEPCATVRAPAPAPPDTPIPAEVTIRAGAVPQQDPPSVEIALGPTEIELAFFDAGVRAELHGVGDRSQPFTFASEGPWSAGFTLATDFLIRDPFFGLVPVARVERLGGAEGAPLFSGTARGQGTQPPEITATLVGGARVTLFPGSPMETPIDLLAGEASLATRADGTFTLVLATPDLGSGDPFRLGGTSLQIQRTAGAVEVRITGPELTLFGGTPFESQLTLLPSCTLASDRFTCEPGAGVLDLPFLGRFGYAGRITLDGTGASFALTTEQLSFPADGSVLTLSPTALFFRRTPDGTTSLDVTTPQVVVFGQALPGTLPGTTAVRFDAAGRPSVSLATLDDVVLAPNLIEVGPGSLDVAYQPDGSLDYALDSDGVRLVRRPVELGGGHLVDVPLRVGGRCGPADLLDCGFEGRVVGNRFDPPLVDLPGVFSLRYGSSGGSLRFGRLQGGGLYLRGENLVASVFGEPMDSGGLSASADVATGIFTVSAGLLDGQLDLGALQLTLAGPVAARLDAGAPAFTLDFPASTLALAGVAGWPAAGVGLPAFTAGSDGSFLAGGIAALVFGGVPFGSAAVEVKRTAAGVVSARATGGFASLDLASGVAIRPSTGSVVPVSLDVTGGGDTDLQMGPARLDLSALGIQGVFGLRSPTGGPFTFSTDGPWSARVTSGPFSLGLGGQELVRVRYAGGVSDPLLFTTVSGNGLGGVSLDQPSFAHPVELVLLPDSPLELTVPVDASATGLSLGLDGTVSLQGPTPATGFGLPGLLRFDGGSIVYQATARGNRLDLVGPTAVLFDASAYEVTVSLPSCRLRPSGFSCAAPSGPVTLGPIGKFSFDGSLAVSASSLSGSVSTAGLAYPTNGSLLSVGASTASLSFTTDGTLTLGLGAPAVSLFGKPIALGVSLTLQGFADGSLSATVDNGFTTALFGSSPGILRMRRGSFGFSRSRTGAYSLSGPAEIRLVHPLGTSTIPFTLSGSDGGFVQVVNPSSAFNSLFDLGWFELGPDTGGRLEITQTPAGSFSLRAIDWDAGLLGDAFFNFDFDIFSSGSIGLDLPPRTFDIGSIRLVAGDVSDVNWNVRTGGFSVGIRTAVDLVVTGVTGLTGSLASGLDLTPFTIQSTGGFTETATRTLDLGGVVWSSASVTLSRADAGSPVVLGANASIGAIDLDLSASSSGSFGAGITGSFGIPTGCPAPTAWCGVIGNVASLDFGCVSMDFRPNDTRFQFAGEVQTGSCSRPVLSFDAEAGTAGTRLCLGAICSPTLASPF